MVATTFFERYPEPVANFVRTQGVAGNMAVCEDLHPSTGVATVFFYARLWRRSGVLTDLEFYELRYSGRAAGRGARLPVGLLGPFLQLHHHGLGEPGRRARLRPFCSA